MATLKRVASLRSGSAITSDQISEEGEYPVYGGGGLRGYTSGFTHEGQFPLIGRQGALCGNVNFADGRFWASEHAVVAKPMEGADPVWLAELLMAMNLGQYSVSAAQPGLAVETIRDLLVPIPPLRTQRSIADFLDRKTRAIADLIRKKERLIELLQEKRHVLIARAVSKGLAPNVRMKDSGVPWLGKIPAHWKLIRTSYAARVFNGSTPARDNAEYWTDEGIPWLASGKVNDDHVIEPTAMISHRALRECALSVVPKGSVLVGLVGQGRTRGMATILGIDATINQNMAAVVPAVGTDGQYLTYVLQAAYEDLRLLGRGANQEALNCEILKAYRVPLPPLVEQRCIAEHLTACCESVSRAQGALRRQLTRLREYRQALISAAITGQIEVTAGPYSVEANGGDAR